MPDSENRVPTKDDQAVNTDTYNTEERKILSNALLASLVPVRSRKIEVSIPISDPFLKALFFMPASEARDEFLSKIELNEFFKSLEDKESVGDIKDSSTYNIE